MRIPRRPLRCSARSLCVTALGGALLAVTIAFSAFANRVHADRPAPRPADGSASTTGTTLPSAPQKARATQFTVAEQPVGASMREADDTLYIVQKLGKIRAWRNGMGYPLGIRAR